MVVLLDSHCGYGNRKPVAIEPYLPKVPVTLGLQVRIFQVALQVAVVGDFRVAALAIPSRHR